MSFIDNMPSAQVLSSTLFNCSMDE